ncbi:hypothetical protein [Rhodopseudomonas pseudopalustris]|uniref:Uncharacterized protein n=1 Tax=Rhodopseudomonas pseudopalustris TaxID=1513892 RepID=A0A1H8VZA6_9BRAD|nr:hypothetical protein [Rhodopseudomonas pseudopalustris]SEP20258.1 hypothetical protein SAMN05444123_11033 [Rhodopseudomonas pseudopalustris]
MKTPARKNAEASFRALTQFSKLPPGHKTLRVPDDSSAPHLNEREFAVVDTTDCDVQHGELFVVQHETGNRRREIVQVRSGHCQITETGPEQLVWWTGELRGWRQIAGGSGGIPVYSGLSDGPFEAQGLQSRLLGRVVGYAATALGDLLAPAAGWENEEAGNAAFDPGEYLDALIAAGHQPYVIQRDGRTIYYEQYPERRQTNAERERVLAARWRWVKASTALARTKVECLQRGLVYEGRAA